MAVLAAIVMIVLGSIYDDKDRRTMEKVGLQYYVITLQVIAFTLLTTSIIVVQYYMS